MFFISLFATTFNTIHTIVLIKNIYGPNTILGCLSQYDVLKFQNVRLCFLVEFQFLKDDALIE